MAVFKCLVSGNTMEVLTALDIESMEKHPGYTLVEEAPKVTKPKKKKEEEEVVETEEL